MKSSAPFFSPTEAARRLRVSVKALRLYEDRGLIMPARTAAGWRAYGPDQMATAAEIVTLRGLGLSLRQIGRVLEGDPDALEPALGAHQASLERQALHLDGTLRQIRSLRADLKTGKTPARGQLAGLIEPAPACSLSLSLPWPWDGETFSLRELTPLTYITGPLGSGKTRLAKALAETIPGAIFLGLERLEDEGAAARLRLTRDAALAEQVEATLAALLQDGATRSDALQALLVGLASNPSSVVVVDMVEQGLDELTQDALMAHLRCRRSSERPLVLMTRSCAILDMAVVGADETIILCPANHSRPVCVTPVPGAPGYEVVATCLASPAVRARTQGVVAMRTVSATLKVGA